MASNLLPLSVVLFASLVAGRIWPGFPTPGNLSEYTTASSNSNYSHTVDFIHDGRAEFGTWRWTLNVTEVEANSTYSDDYFTGARSAYTTYSFAWPGQGTLSDALRREVVQDPALVRTGSCAVLLSVLFPPNVTSTYDDSSSDCTSMLGTQCVTALKGMVSAVEYENGECRLRSGSFSALSSADCNAAFGHSLGGLGGLATPFGNYSRPLSNATNADLAKGQIFAYAASQAFPADNTTVFDLVATNVHVLGLTGQVPTLICNRATSKGLQLRNSTAQGGQPSAVPPSSASGIAVNMAVVMGLVTVLTMILL